jgi:metal transporter CNNM
VIMSVTLVLFFGEIVPSAIFTGPNKVALAYQMVPLVKFVMILLWPLSFPIAKLLDHVLHDENSETPDAFGRGELSALVRIQYEERMAQKQRVKATKAAVAASATTKGTGTNNAEFVDNVGALDFASTQSIKASKKTIDRLVSSATTSSSTTPPSTFSSNVGSSVRASTPLLQPVAETEDPRRAYQAVRSVSIHLDEVSMVEGALSMKTKVALDVYTPMHRIMAIPYDMLLTENNMIDMYARGFSRIPVYQPNPVKPKDHTAIVGVLMTKRLILVDAKEERPLSTLPLTVPQCVSPKMNLVDLLNLFQSGTLGHLALVCARPVKGQKALDQGDPLPEAAGLMG